MHEEGWEEIAYTYIDLLDDGIRVETLTHDCGCTSILMGDHWMFLQRHDGTLTEELIWKEI